MEQPCPEHQLPDLSKLVVLVIDDDEDCRELLATLLEVRHATVSRAGSAAEGLERVIQDQPSVVVSDIAMPGEDGYSFMRRLRSLPQEQGGATPTIALTAFSQPRDRAEAVAAGFTCYLPKPVDLALLCEEIRRLGHRDLV